MHACRDEPGDVRHVGEDFRADAVGGRADAREIDDPRVRARADDNHLRFVRLGQPVQLVVVEALVVLAHAVGHDGVEQAGEVQRVAVRQVTAVRQVHAEDRVARLEQRQVHRHVRLRARVRLHVRVFRAEERFRAGDGQAFRDVDEFAAAVVAPARVALGVLVRHHRARGFEDRATDEVLGRDELETRVLSMSFVPDRVGDVRIGLRERAPGGRRGLCGHGRLARLKPRRYARLKPRRSMAEI